uniref:Uncharacterized protein n=1 Tax=Arundo donax TaxID=35708 RepID=A0A0A9FIR2_ARUDO
MRSASARTPLQCSTQRQHKLTN